MEITRRQAAVGTVFLAGGVGAAAAPTVTARPWGRLADGQAVTLFTLTNRHGLSVEIADYGGIVVSLRTPDRTGRMGDIVLGFDSLDRYVTDSPMFGAIIGRYANRIGHGRFVLDGREHQLALNADGLHSMHGGSKGWDKAVWRSRPFEDRQGPALELTLVSPDGDQGFPGTVRIVATYRLTHDNWLTLEARAVTDTPTIINLTNHSYFNLSGDGGRDALDHDLQIAASTYTVKDGTGLPTGMIAPVAGTPLDFREPKPVGRDIAAFPGGYDHNFVIDPVADGALRKAARLGCAASGRGLELWTDQPGLQFYSAHWLNVSGKAGVHYGPASGLCLEPQHFPDSPNQPGFPSTVLRPGQQFIWRTHYRFGLHD
jgi:aldose 1-epimerase